MSEVEDGVNDSDLVFALVSPIGSDVEKVATSLVKALSLYQYKVESVRLSEFLVASCETRGVELPAPFSERKSALMHEGNEICRVSGLKSAVAVHGVIAIRNLRGSERVAFVLNSLKRPQEVELLRNIYQERLLVFGLQASLETRISQLVTTLRSERARASQKELENEARTLIDRDLQEFDFAGELSHGQNVLKTLPMADVFINMDSHVDEQVERVVRLLFNDPDCDAPTEAEYAMYLADATSLRSQELGRRVGAVLMRSDMSIVGVGANSHPVEDGAPNLDHSSIGIRDLVGDLLTRLGSEHLAADLFERLETDHERVVTELLSGALSSAKVRDLTEFMQPVHAEMNAILDAAKHGVATAGSTAYVTAYPCHQCARHLIALGIPVKYIEPYPKSRAELMYGDAVNSFTPFEGIAPRQYGRLFGRLQDNKDALGHRRKWSQEERHFAQPKLAESNWSGVRQREAAAIRDLRLLNPLS